MSTRKLLAFARPDGGVSLFTVLREAETDQEALDAEEASLRTPAPSAAGTEFTPVPADWQRLPDIDPADLPADRGFRDAWRWAADAVRVDMPKAREIHRDRIRAARVPLLAAADVAYLRALEAGQDTAPIVARKNALRDAPDDPAIDAAPTPEALAAVWPAALDEAV